MFREVYNCFMNSIKNIKIFLGLTIISSLVLSGCTNSHFSNNYTPSKTYVEYSIFNKNYTNICNEIDNTDLEQDFAIKYIEVKYTRGNGGYSEYYDFEKNIFVERNQKSYLEGDTFFVNNLDSGEIKMFSSSYFFDSLLTNYKRKVMRVVSVSTKYNNILLDITQFCNHKYGSVDLNSSYFQYYIDGDVHQSFGLSLVEPITYRETVTERSTGGYVTYTYEYTVGSYNLTVWNGYIISLNRNRVVRADWNSIRITEFYNFETEIILL